MASAAPILDAQVLTEDAVIQPLFDFHSLDFGRLLFRRADGSRLLLPVAPCVLRLVDRVVLVDAGFDPGLAGRVDGVEWQRPAKDPLEQLSELGITADDVGDVILTHLHDDHGGGVFDRARQAPVFPNARLHVQELALWRGLDRVARGGERFVSGELLEWLDTWPLTERHHGDWRLCDELGVYHTGGHTPGHQIALIGEGRLLRISQDDDDGSVAVPPVELGLRWQPGGDGGAGDLLLGGDLLSLKACFDAGFRTSSDVEPERALLRRQELAAASRAGLRCYLYHGTTGRRLTRLETAAG